MSGRLFDDALSAWDAAGLRRTLEVLGGVDFCTNDYLGLARDEGIAEAAAEAARTWGAGSRAARLLGGQLPIHAALEHAAAAWMGTEAALLFPSGYQANVGVLSTLCGAGDVIFSDADNHASLIDGARLSKARVEVFAHGDVDALRSALRGVPSGGRRWIVVESVYSMDGTLAPLDELAALAAEHDAWLIIDEAHAAGLYGPAGQGRVASMRDAARVAARIVTGGKALGAAGALVGGSANLIALLLNRARSFVFTTAPAPAVVGALHAAIDAVQNDTPLRERVHAAARRLRSAINMRGESPIVFVPIGRPGAAVEAAHRLQAEGLHVRAVRPPTVRPGQSGLRIVCHAVHDNATIDRLANHLNEVVPALRSAPEAPVPTARGVVVIGTDTDVGKTVASAVLVRAMARRGETVRYWKPMQTGDVLDTDTVSELSGMPTTDLPVVQLALPASIDQAAEAEGTHVSAAETHAALQAGLRAHPESVFVLETAGGLLVPLNDTEDQADVLAGLELPTVLVARSGLGTLNHTRLTIEALRRRGMTPLALLLIGPPHPANVKTLRTWLPETPLFELPLLDPLTPAAIDAWLDATPIETVLP